MGYPQKTPGLINPHEVVVALAEILGDREDEVRLAALIALERFGRLDPAGPPGALVAALEERSVRTRAAAIKAVASFPCSLDPWLPFLLRCSEQDEPPVRYACWLALARWKPPAVSAAAIPTLLAALGSKSRIVRSHAAIALHPYMDDPRAVGAIPALLAMIREPSEPDRNRPGDAGPCVLRPIDHGLAQTPPGCPPNCWAASRPERSRPAQSSPRWPRSCDPGIPFKGSGQPVPWASSARPPRRPSPRSSKP